MHSLQRLASIGRQGLTHAVGSAQVIDRPRTWSRKRPVRIDAAVIHDELSRHRGYKPLSDYCFGQWIDAPPHVPAVRRAPKRHSVRTFGVAIRGKRNQL
jgi:hypothetical protein